MRRAARLPSPASPILQALLDFSHEPFDVGLLDRVVMAFYSGSGNEVCSSSHHSMMIKDLTMCGSDGVATNVTTRLDSV